VPKINCFRRKSPHVACYWRYCGLVGWFGLWATFRHTCHGKKITIPLAAFPDFFPSYTIWQIWSKERVNKCRFCLSIDLVCKVEKSALENSSLSFRQSTFRVSFHGFVQKRPRNYSIPPKLSVANSFNIEGKVDRRVFKLWVSCGFFNKRDLWKTMHR